LANHPGLLRVFLRCLANKKRRNVAVVATARKVVVLTFELLRRNEPYCYASPRPTAATSMMLPPVRGETNLVLP
jgi:transposase